MREILFRGKRTINGEWIEGFYTCFNGKEYRIYSGYAETDCGDYYPDCDNIDPKTVGEYTGLTDKNGKKIFEGDIIDTPDRLVKVVWFEGNAQFDLHFIRYKDDVTTTNFKGIHMRDLKEYEVIGNIHDNPELLEG